MCCSRTSRSMKEPSGRSSWSRRPAARSYSRASAVGIERRTAILFFTVFLAAVFALHAPFFHLPFFWDEVGQFIPAALDLYRFGALAPVSVTPTAHPPGVMAYLAAV